MVGQLRRLPLLAGLLAAGAGAQTILHVDASAPAPTPTEGQLRMGAAIAPNGERLSVNNQYLSRNGTPWMPVMGEFHYSRSPAASWDRELRKMKAAGIAVVATYVMWNHHEASEGQFDWKDGRDLRRFVQAAARAGLEVVVRIGPWVHAEVRYGGFPDWVVTAMPTRRDDPQYLGHVERLYRQIGLQLKGLLFKDGGPVVGVQIENEYTLNGPGEGAGHIMALKRLALQAGLDVPLYTVTGWDHTVYPTGEVTPVFGGYVDEPWARSTAELPPKETYAFRFDTRVSGDLGAQTRATQKGTAESDIASTPFLGAEYGAGLPFMYRRRPVVSPDDIAAMLPVQLGSGVNLVGYYMFHGGRNPYGAVSLEESTLAGGYNDTPMINYDFQAPLGPDGQQRPVLAYLRPFHLFLRDFGARLAPMTVRRPDLTPRGQDDLATPRWSVRSRGESAFVFVNNHVRQYATPRHQAVQFAIDLPGQTLRLPSRPLDIPAGAYFIWPVNFDLDGIRLRYATAQPLARLDRGKEGVVYVFGASAGVPVEFAFDAAAATAIDYNAPVRRAGELALVDGIVPGTTPALTLRRVQGGKVTLLVLTPEQARQLTVGQVAGQRRLLLSGQQLWLEQDGIALRSTGSPAFGVSVYPPLTAVPAAAAALHSSSDGMFQRLEARLTARAPAATVSPLREARKAGPIALGGLAKAALQPAPEAFKSAAAWRIDVARAQLKGLDDVLLEADFVGDIGRLFAGTRLLDDWYYSGYGWQMSMKLAGAGPLTLAVLPLRADAPVYLPKEARPDFGGQDQIAQLRALRLTPVYRLDLRLRPERR